MQTKIIYFSKWTGENIKVAKLLTCAKLGARTRQSLFETSDWFAVLGHIWETSRSPEDTDIYIQANKAAKKAVATTRALAMNELYEELETPRVKRRYLGKRRPETKRPRISPT